MDEGLTLVLYVPVVLQCQFPDDFDLIWSRIGSVTVYECHEF